MPRPRPKKKTRQERAREVLETLGERCLAVLEENPTARRAAREAFKVTYGHREEHLASLIWVAVTHAEGARLRKAGGGC